MKAITAPFLISSALALIACAPSGRGDDGGGDDDGSNNPDTPDAGMVAAGKCSKMDILFVVDDSGSMAEEQGNLASNFPQFATLLSNYTNAEGQHIDFRVAVTTTGRTITYTIQSGPISLPTTEEGDNGAFREGCGVSRRWLEPTDTNLGSALSCRAGVGTSGPGYEMPLLMSKFALADRVSDGTNAGFLRQDALLGIVYLTDEDDSSTTQNNFTLSITSPGPTPNWNPQDQITFLDNLKGHRSRWAAGVIAGEQSCSSSFGDAAEATRLKQFVQMTNANGPQQAVFSSICAGDLTTALDDVISKFQAACGGIIL
ncbi:MAG: hypothetical protein SFX73_13755 [Kofleriaceae bacterium]|nr:hypothetical protein [Kofleriaceae bacterium]